MNLEGGFQPGDLRGVVRRRGKVALFVTLGIALLAYWIAMALPNMYTSYATVLVEPQAVDAELVRAGVQASDLNARLGLMTAQILSRPRLSRIIEKFDLYQEEQDYMLREAIIDLMRSRVRVEPVASDLEDRTVVRQETDINQFRIFFSDYRADVARDVAQQLANDFIETHINERVQVSQKSLEFIQGELERLADRIEAVEAQIADVKNENPGRLPDDMMANQRRLERLLSDLAVAQRAYAEAASDEGFYANQAMAAQGWAGNDEASPARRLELLRLELGELRSRGFTDKHPDIITTKAEIEELRQAIETGGETSSELAQTSLLQQQAQAQANRAGLRKDAALAEIERLQEAADEIQALIGSTPQVEEKLDALNREYEHLFSSFQDFSKRHQEAMVQAQLERRQLGEQFRVLEAAFKAPEPSSPNRVLIILLGVMFGMAGGGGVALLMEATDSAVHDPRRLQSRFQLPVLVSIPQIWLEADRVKLRRQRLRTAAATIVVVLFCLAGGAASWFWVNGGGSAEEAAPGTTQATQG